MKYNEFKTKEQYLTYRSEWKAEYKKLSKTIRCLRYMTKEESRACNISHEEFPNRRGTNYFTYLDRIQKILGLNKRYQRLKLEANDNSYYLNKYTKLATQMLEELKLAKIESQKQYQSQKNS